MKKGGHMKTHVPTSTSGGLEKRENCPEWISHGTVNVVRGDMNLIDLWRK
jgi:hypothetical protein